MSANTDRERLPIRRLASCVLVALTAIALATGSAQSEDAPAQGKLDHPKLDEPKLEDPPPLDDLLKPPPSSKPGEVSKYELPEFHRTLRCEPGQLSCNDPIGFGAQALYARIRDCWHPPLGVRMTTAIFFGQNVTQAADPAEATLALTLDTDGKLSSQPHLNAPAALGGAVNDLVGAVERCQPYNMLPSAKYPEWKDVLLRIRIEHDPR